MDFTIHFKNHILCYSYDTHSVFIPTNKGKHTCLLYCFLKLEGRADNLKHLTVMIYSDTVSLSNLLPTRSTALLSSVRLSRNMPSSFPSKHKNVYSCN